MYLNHESPVESNTRLHTVSHIGRHAGQSELIAFIDCGGPDATSIFPSMDYLKLSHEGYWHRVNASDT